MKKNYLSIFLFLLCSNFFAQTSVCDPNGDLIIYSNYDGGYLNINVDQNIPNLKIGVLTYEGVKITISGTYASNVVKVWYAGANSSNNHCGAVIATGVTGIPSNLDSIEVFPSATLSDPNGDASMVCATGCSNGNSGGCNTTNQVVDYFMTKMNTTKLLFHQTQYGCFLNNQTWNVSAGGNCCLVPPSVGINKNESNSNDLVLYPNPAENILKFRMHSSASYQVEIFSLNGESVLKKNILSPILETQELSINSLANGIYYFKVMCENGAIYKKFVVNK